MNLTDPDRLHWTEEEFEQLTELLLDNAATASQERSLLRDNDEDETALREAVRLNVVEPLLKIIRHMSMHHPG